MTVQSLDTLLLQHLLQIDEIELAGFSVRGGLTGSGVTLLQGRTYIGSWRVTAGSLVWSQASHVAPNHFESTVDGAARHTLLVILKIIQGKHEERIAALAS